MSGSFRLHKTNVFGFLWQDDTTASIEEASTASTTIMANGAVTTGSARRDARLQQLEQFGLDDAVVQEVLKKIQARRLAERRAAQMSNQTKGIVNVLPPPPKKSAMKSDKTTTTTTTTTTPVKPMKEDASRKSNQTAKTTTSKTKKAVTKPVATTTSARKNPLTKLTATWNKRKEKSGSNTTASTVAVAATGVAAATAASAATVEPKHNHESKGALMNATAADEEPAEEPAEEPVDAVPEESNEPTRKYKEEFEVVPPEYAQRSRGGFNENETKMDDDHSLASDDGTELTNLTDLPDEIKAILTNRVLDADRKVNRGQYDHTVDDHHLSQDLLTSILEEYFCNGCGTLSLWEETEEEKKSEDDDYHDNGEENEYHEEEEKHEHEEEKHEHEEENDTEEHKDQEEEHKDQEEHDDDVNKGARKEDNRTKEFGGVRSLVASRLKWRSKIAEEFDYHEPVEYDEDSSESESEDDSDDDSSLEDDHKVSKEEERSEFTDEINEEPSVIESLAQTDLEDASVKDEHEPEGEGPIVEPSAEGDDIVEGVEIPFEKQESVTKPTEARAAFAEEAKSVSQRMKSFFRKDS